MSKLQKMNTSSKSKNYIPSCCQKHRQACVGSKNIDVSRWKFSDDISKDLISDNVFVKKQEKEKTKPDYAELEKHEESMAESRSTSCSMKELFISEPGTCAEDSRENCYLNFLLKIEECEDEVKQQEEIEDVEAKAVEARIERKAKEFCEWTSCFVTDDKKQNLPDSAPETMITPDMLTNLFHVELCKSTICPYVPYIVRDVKDTSTHKTSKAEKATIIKGPKIEEKKKFKHFYYMPLKTNLDQKKKVDQKASSEEKEAEELMTLFSTKMFLDFLKEHGKEPPKVLTRFQCKKKEKNVI